MTVKHRFVILLAALSVSCTPARGHGTILGRALAQQQQQQPAESVPYADQLSRYLRQASVPGRPVSAKNLEAALYLSYAQAGALVPDVPSVNQPIAGGNSSVLVAWQNSTSAALLAFPANVSEPAVNETDAGFAPADVQSLLQGDFEGAYAAASAADSPFLSLLNGSGRGAQGLQELIGNVSDSQEPRRVVCTGYGNGGAYAQLCGVWAAVVYPSAQIRVVAFGAPRVGNDAFAFAFQQLADLSYLWSTSTHLDVTNATIPGLAASDQVRVLNDTATVADRAIPRNSFQQYVSAVIEYFNVTSSEPGLVPGVTAEGAAEPTDEEGGISGFFDDIGDAIGGVADRASNIFDQLGTVAGVAADGDNVQALIDAFADQGSQTNDTAQTQRQLAIVAAARAEATGCLPLLCKIRTNVATACALNNNGTAAGAPTGYIPIVANATDTGVAVGWNASTRTATIVFEGSGSRQDWVQNFKLLLTDARFNTALDQIFPNVQLHTGFLENFRSVTDQAATPAQNISAALDRLTAGVEPNRVEIAGHSLGGALASIAGAWAALQYPTADIRVVTFGAPYIGNRMFAEAYKLLAGREQRVVSRLDIVPALPPVEDYVHPDYGRWIRSNTSILLQDRPESGDLGDYNWDDHSCLVGYAAPVYRTNFTTAPPDIAGALANSSTGASSASPNTATGPSGAEDSSPAPPADQLAASGFSLPLWSAVAAGLGAAAALLL